MFCLPFEDFLLYAIDINSNLAAFISPSRHINLGAIHKRRQNILGGGGAQILKLEGRS